MCRRPFAYLFFLLLTLTPAGEVRAQLASCVDPTQSWSWAYSADIIQSIMYYLAFRLLSVTYADTTMHIQANVPTATAQRFQTLGFGVSPDKLWKSIRNYSLEVLQAQNHCPLLSQNGGYLLASPATFFPNGQPPPALLLSEDGRQLLDDRTGAPLSAEW
jgi:hypothetical protein